jgi:transposase
MPWRQVDAMSERLRFVQDARQRLVTFTELCARYGISRFPGYKWLARANASGLDFLQELSRRPHSCPHATPPPLQARLLEARRHHPTWGPRKLLARVRRQDRRRGLNFAWPARSTVAELLRRNGLTTPRRRRGAGARMKRSGMRPRPRATGDRRGRTPVRCSRSSILRTSKCGW